jgi:hypothetical protein
MTMISRPNIDSVFLCPREAAYDAMAYMLWRIECDFIILREANATTSRRDLVLFCPLLPGVTGKPEFSIRMNLF